MTESLKKSILIILCFLFIPLTTYSADSYKNFNVAIYSRVYDVLKMGNQQWLEKNLNLLQKYIHIDKIYLETHRDMVIADKELIYKLKDFYVSKGIETSGGITTVVSERDRFRSFCYTNTEHREKIKEIVEYTAELFDEVILDDFFFTNCKCEACIKAKGKKSWTQYRLELMEEVSKNLVIKPARAVNPNVTMIIKYPNWYDHYQFLGYNLEAEPKLFDMIYTGTETRDPEYRHQHLQQYQSYSIMRYLENIKPGKNGGGWIDPFARRYLDLYAEQIRLTLFSKPKEVTLFCFEHLVEDLKQKDKSYDVMSTVAPVAGNVFKKVDSFLDHLGQPYGIPSYKPYHSSGEDFLHNYIGMLGIPMNITPDFPYESNTIFLTECAKFDKTIVDKIKGQLVKGKNVVITSGLLKALQNKGIEDIVELEYTDKKALVNQFSQFTDIYYSKSDIIIPQIRYMTNDSWETITCYSKGIGYPLMIQADYANATLYVLVIPDNFADLYNLPPETITQIKHVMMKDIDVHVESPSHVCLFIYDNNTFIVESFMPNRIHVNIVVNNKNTKLKNMLTDEEISGDIRGDNSIFKVRLEPHSYKVFKYNH